ncbi:MAG: phosphatase PAP2 family protein [Actinomycetota bacterium]|nr:phosphatase PAP2 family protein [Actinomycetota bacterium]
MQPSRHPVATLVVAVVAIALITSIGFALRADPTIDSGTTETLNALHAGPIGNVTTFVYRLFSPVPAVILTVILAAGIWAASGRLRLAAAFAGVVAATWIPSDIIKLMVHRPRPDPHLMAHPYTPLQVDPSYPSGHMVFVTVLVIALIYVLHGSRWSRLAVSGGALLIIGVAASLTIDAVHYPTDVAASIIWSFALAPAARLICVDWVLPHLPFLRERNPPPITSSAS